MLEVLSAELGISFKILMVKKKTDNFTLHGIVFEKLSRLKILIKCRHLTIIDAIHITNRLD